jgi:NAD(P)-dependent dehydrogenase (short-subunit alcohol dehydrogenase family)
VGTDMFSLDGKIAVVTGASRGIGKAIALGFAKAGADIAVAARNQGELETVAKEVDSLGRRALVVPTDVTVRDQIQALIDRTVEELGGIHVLVNNAGGTRFMSPIVGLRPEGWDKVLALNLDSVFHATQIGAQAMLAHDGGSIIQISSVAGISGAQGLSFYSAAKGGARLMTQAVAKELASSNVRLNTIAPGWIETDLNVAVRTDESTKNFLESTIPMSRFGRPDEVVGAAIFLASDASSFVTGTTLVVDGGQTA